MYLLGHGDLFVHVVWFFRLPHLWCMHTAGPVPVLPWYKVHRRTHRLRVSVKVQEVPKRPERIHIQSYRINLKFETSNNRLPTRRLFISDGSPVGQRILFIRLSIRKYESVRVFRVSIHIVLTPNSKTIKYATKME